ncbi:MAG: hypothetical protein ACREP6_09000 [Candidatus Binataceae bacterium]
MFAMLVFVFSAGALAAPRQPVILQVIPKRVNFARLNLNANPSPEIKYFALFNRATYPITVRIPASSGIFQLTGNTITLESRQKLWIAASFNPQSKGAYVQVIQFVADAGRPAYAILRGVARGYRTNSDVPAGSTPTPTPSDVSTPTPTPAATPTMTSATPTPTPTATAKPMVNASLMFSIGDYPFSQFGNVQQYGQVTVTILSSTSSGTLVAPVHSATVILEGLAQCVVLPVTAPVGTVIEVYGSANGYLSQYPLTPSSANHAVSPRVNTTPTVTGLNISGYSIGLQSFQSYYEPFDPNAADNQVDPAFEPYNPYNLIWSLFYSTSITLNGVEPPGGPYTYRINGCMGDNVGHVHCPTAANYYNTYEYYDYTTGGNLDYTKPDNSACTVLAPLN